MDDSRRSAARAGRTEGWRAAFDGPPLPSSVRWISLLFGMVALGGIMVASQLRPDPSGRGTHQQLGLPPCSFVLFWNVPCPACGMTTSWTLVMRGRLASAMQANAGGAMLAIIALAYIPISCYFFLRGVATRGQWFSMLLAAALTLALLAAVVQWIVRMAVG